MREMKDSGIEWIGEIPKEWEISTIKQEYLFQTGGTPKTDIESYFEGENIWVNISDMKSKFITDSAKHISDDAVNSTSMSISPKGSLLYAFKLSVGAVAFCEKDMYTNEAIATFLSCNNSLEYLYYMAPIFIIMNANENIYGAKLLNQKLIKNAKIIIPPLAEQQKISAYLDTKCNKIDSIIEKQEKIIEKLKAYKLSVITEAVTKGLNPDVKMKDSGVEWIGEIPEECKVTRAGHIFSIILGKMLSPTPKQDDDSFENYLCAANVHFTGISYEPLKQMWFSEIEKQIYAVHRGDLLVVEGGAGAGGAAIVEEKLDNCYIQNSIMIVRSKGNVSNKWLYYTLYAIVKRNYVDFVCNKATIPHFTKDKLGNVPVVIFTKENETEIVNYLDKKCSAIDKSIDKKQAIIEKLKEYKKSLIYEVVTGKKEVFSEEKAVAVICPVGIPTNEEEYAKILLMQKIITRCGKNLKGRTHLMKIFHALELELGFSFCSLYTRYIHGPYDSHIEEYENALVHKGWIKLKKGKNVEYIVVNPIAYKMDYNRIFAEYNKDIERIIDFFKQMKRTSKAEKVATLLASWNDFLIDGVAEPTDDMIINDVMNNWTDNKKNTSYETWLEILNQMRKAKIVPHGYGRHTIKMD